MPLTGKFGPYEIIALIGAGGMGEVYRARDTRLGREVAIKILPEEFARDEDRMRRFGQEARAIAALNHPNVVSIYDTGLENGVPYLVSELLEGESLRQRLEQGPIPQRKTIEYARQITDGLAAAHEKGVVHRDLKPENLFLTNGGRVKILDFGLAKQAPDQGATADGATATIAAVTNPGVVMGTAGYMAPEQVRGHAVDHRADIFSFGAVLYEMLSGQRAFHRETAVETLNAILKEDPPELDIKKLHVAPGLERIVHHCLEKKAADRFQSARDLSFALASLSDTTTAQRAVEPVRASSRRRWIGVAAALLFAAAAAVWTFVVLRGRQPERADFAIPVHGEVSHLAISQDGKWLAFVSPGDSGLPKIYVQRVGSNDVRVLPGTEGASYPFWSPDAKFVAFFANNRMQKVAISGGEPQTITAVGGNPRGASWGSKGVIIYARDVNGPLWRVNADGTGTASLTDKLLQPGNASHRWPCFLPDGDHFLMLAANFGEAQDQAVHEGIFLTSLSKLEANQLNSANSSIGFANGRLYFVNRDGALVAAKVDLRAGQIEGAPKVIASQVAKSPSTIYGVFSVSDDATVVYSTNTTPTQSQLTWFDENGKELGRIGAAGVLANPVISPDGKRVAFDSEDFKANKVDVWITDLERGGSSRFTFDPVEETTPVWSRDGSTLAFRNGFQANLVLKKANGLEANHPLPSLSKLTDDLIPNAWTPGDREVLVTFQPDKNNYRLMLVPVDGSKFRFLSNGSGNQTNGQFSPDGKWVAYASDESGNWEIYVTNYPGASGKWQVTRGGGSEPRWSGDGKTIFYIAPGQMLTKVEVSAGDTFSASVPRPLFPIHTRAPISSTDVFNYDVTRDGKRFLVNQYIKPDQPPPLSIILNADGATGK